MTRPTRKHPRPYDPRLAQKICDDIATGRRLEAICKARKVSPCAVYRWLVEHNAFRLMYLQAKHLSSQSVAEQMLGIADDGGGEGGLPRDRLRVQARRQFLGLLPKTLAPLSELDGLNLLPEHLEEIDFRDE